ncbi:MAG: LD-carboxypeptidase [Patescibacteria group bacterium]
MNDILLPKKICKGDTIGIIAPSRPVYNIEEKIKKGAEVLEDMGYKVVFGRNIKKQLYYSAGTPQERADDLNEMFSNPKISMILCATGGITSNQLLPYIDFDIIKNNPKPFIGYSDITTLLLAIYKKTGLVTFHGPDLSDIAGLNKDALQFLFNLLSGEIKNKTLSQDIEIIQEGTAIGKLIGGNIYLINGLLGTPFSPSLDGSIFFWEETGVPPAMVHQELMHLKLAGALDDIRGIVIGHLSDCIDNKYENENRSINEIIIEVINNKNIPIIKVDSFGHDINDFYTFPIGLNAEIDTVKKYFSLK